MKKKRKAIVPVITVLVLLLVACGGYYAYNRWFANEDSQNTVYVQSVAEITGAASAGLTNRYSGIVEAREQVEINPEGELAVKECFVSAGDTVKIGTPLFAYDVDSLALSYEQLLLDITGVENTLIASREEITSLETRIERARESQKYELTLELQTVQLTVKKSEYELSEKQKQAEQMKSALENGTVFSPVSGIVRSVKSDSSNDPYAYYGYGSEQGSDAYITIVAGNDYCVKGTVSEQSVHSLYEGMEVVVRSRLDQNVTYTGSIYLINTEETQSSGSSSYYYGSDGESSSKYAFYVALDDTSGLLMGQHVLIEPSIPEPAAALSLAEHYIIVEDGAYFVYAADSAGKIEKREITVGEYYPDSASYEILGNLSLTDRIAFPDDNVAVGMPVSETQYAPADEEPSGDNLFPEESGVPESIIIGG
ncbi:MAG: hypothetical protein Q4C04_06650 [Clostridia bacterium]|nr:hypothetical protein [Clostridia bacterium]